MMNTSFKWFLDILAGVGRNQRGVEQVWFGKVDVGLTKLYFTLGGCGFNKVGTCIISTVARQTLIKR